jgi:hypothetical protein
MMRLLPLLFLPWAEFFLLMTFFRTGFSQPYQGFLGRLGSPK